MKALEREREALRRNSIRPLAVPNHDRIWESDLQILGNEGEVLRLPVVSAVVLPPNVFMFGSSSFFGPDTF